GHRQETARDEDPRGGLRPGVGVHAQHPPRCHVALIQHAASRAARETRQGTAAWRRASLTASRSKRSAHCQGGPGRFDRRRTVDEYRVRTATLVPGIRVVRSAARLRTETSWLDSWHCFSYGRHYEPDNTHHGLLLVCNDDRLRGSP